MTEQITSYWIESTLLTFAVSILITGILIPKIILIAFRKQLFDQPDERKIHRGVVPRLGGIAFFPAILFSVALVAGINLRGGNEYFALALEECAIPLLFEVCAVILLYLVGIADDLIGVRYRAKFVVQIISGILIVSSGMYIGNFYGLLWLDEIPMWLSWMFTILVIVGIVNAINLIDGIDGLASGLSAIALITYTIVFFQGGQYIFAMLAAGAAGTLVPFFYYNVFGDPGRQKKIFMGDTGSLTTGLILVFCSIAVVALYPVSTHPYAYNPVVIAVCPLMIPAFDVVRVYFHRIRCHRNPFLPDKGHIHHKLLALGMKQSSALLFILLASAIFIGCNVMLSPYTNPNLLFGADIVVWTLANILLTKAIRRREKRLGVTLYE